MGSLPVELEERVYEIWLDGEESQREAAFEAVRREHPEHAEAIAKLREKLVSSDAVLGRVHSGVGHQVPERVGDYEVLEEVGAGGFGVVYRARQRQPVDRIVAIKLLLAGRVHGAGLIRFENEKQSLALMDHPSIAQVFDAGTTGDGQPYFVMEFVDGVPITEFCDRQELDVDARLDLFGRVCAAVQHAHQKGVVHRDIKPSNVLVYEQDGRPTPKIIDFGVAKAVAAESAREAYATIEGGLVGTPEYMSPEQASSQPIDTRTDVYALGVLLFELLTGELPFGRDRMTTGSLAEVARIVCHEEPRRPSEVASRTSGLRADLDWIVLKALQKDPADRYASAATLAADVERSRSHEPVEARQPAFLYVARKFARRHRVGVAVAAVLLLVLSLGIAGLIWGLFEVGAARDQAVLSAYAANLGAAQLALDAGAVAVAERRLEETPAELRGWEWRYLDAICDQSAIRVDLEKGSLSHVAWLSDTRLLVLTVERQGIHVVDLPTGSIVRSFDGFDAYNSWVTVAADRASAITSSNRGIEQWRIATGERVARFGEGGSRNDPALSPDGSEVAWIGEDRIVRIAPLSGGAAPREVWACPELESAICFTPTGRSLAIADFTKGRTLVTEIDAATGEKVRDIEVDTLPVDFLQFDVSGSVLFTGGLSGRLRAWDFASGELEREYLCPDRVAQVFQTPDGRRVYASGGWFVGWVNCWDTETSELLGRFNGHRRGVGSCAMAPDGARFATASRDGTVRIWPLRSRPRFVDLEVGTPARQMSLSLDGRRLATASTTGEWKVWDADTLEVVGHGETDHYFRGCAVEGDVVYACGEELCGYDVASGEQLFPPRVCPDDSVWDLLVAADGAVIGRTQFGRIVRFDPRASSPGQFVDLPFQVTLLRREAGSDRLVASCGDGVVRFLQSSTLTVVEAFEATPGVAVAYSAQHGDLLAVCNEQGTIHVFDRSNGGTPVVCRGPDGRGMPLAFSKDGTRLMSGSADKTVRIWDPATGTELLALDTLDAAWEVFFSNDGCKLFVRSQRWWESEASIQVFEAPAR